MKRAGRAARPRGRVHAGGAAPSGAGPERSWWGAKIADSFTNPLREPMSDIEARVKKIIAEQLGVEESQVTN
ncbi:MAG TPA: hypothetical protein VGD93_07780, partial [Devosia sp.]